MTEPGSCGGHGGLPPELRALALLALDRLEPAVERLRDLPANAPAPGAAVCASCPLCAVLSVLRGERPEMAARLVEHASGLVALLRATLLTTAPAGGTPEPPPASGPSGPGESRGPAGRVDPYGWSSPPDEQDGSAGPLPVDADPPAGAPTGVEPGCRCGGEDQPRARSRSNGDQPVNQSATTASRTTGAGLPGRGGRPVQRIPVTR
jgi:hypothetical protein